MNTKDGGKKMKQTMIEKYGSEEAYREEMRRRARKGGKASSTGGFGHPTKGSKLASKAGKKSKPNKKKEN